MDNLNKDIRNKFRAESELPESYSWDNIGENIIHKTTGISAKKKSRRFSAWFLFSTSILFLLFMAVFSFYSEQQEEKIETTLSENLTEHEYFRKKVQVENLSKQKTSVSNETNSLSVTEKITEHQTVFHEKNQSTSKPASLKKNAIMKLSNERNQSTETRNYVNLPEQLDVINPIDLNMPPHVSTDVLVGKNNQEEKSNSNSQKLEYIHPIDLLNNSGLIVLSRKEIIPPMYLPVTENMITPVTKPSKLGLQWGAGISYWLPGFSGDQFNTVNRSTREVGLVSYASSLGLKYKLSNNWNIYVGLEYTNFSSKLDYYDRRDTTVVENIHVSTSTNLLTGEIEEIYADHEYEGYTWNEVIHFNEYKLLSLPVIINRTLATYSKTSFDIGAGLRYTRFFTPSGRGLALTFSDHTKYKVVDLSERNLKKASIDFLLSTSFQYQLSKKLSCGIQINGTWSPMDLDASEEFSFKPLGLVSQVKLGYNF